PGRHLRDEVPGARAAGGGARRRRIHQRHLRGGDAAGGAQHRLRLLPAGARLVRDVRADAGGAARAPAGHARPVEGGGVNLRIDPFHAPWRWPEALPWLAVVAAWFVWPDYLPLGTQVLIGALFALSLDLALGYAGIATLGHAAYLGLGAYVAGWLGK